MTKAADEVPGELVDKAQLLTAAKLTGRLVFDPRCLCGDKSFTCLQRTEGLVRFQLFDIECCYVESPRKLCIDSARICQEHAAPSDFLKPGRGGLSGRLASAAAEFVALEQADGFRERTISTSIGSAACDDSLEHFCSRGSRVREGRYSLFALAPS